MIVVKSFESPFRLLCPMKYFLLSLLMAATAVIGAENQKALKDIPLKDIDGKETSLKAFAGKVLLIVNVASKCGNTPQYKDLEAAYGKYKDQGLVIMGFPCNDFGGQEPGTNEEVKTFCTTKYNVTFPMFDKVQVKGEPKHPLYEALTGKKGAFPGDVKWNFGKFLVGRDGKPIMRIEPKTKVTDAAVVEAIEKALAKK